MGQVARELVVMISPFRNHLSPRYLFCLASLSISSWLTSWARIHQLKFCSQQLSPAYRTRAHCLDKINFLSGFKPARVGLYHGHL